MRASDIGGRPLLQKPVPVAWLVIETAG